MKKILTIVATAGLICVGNGAAHAAGSIDAGGKGATVEITGNNPASCEITAILDGTDALTPDDTPAVKLTTTGNGAEVTVKCNVLASTLTIGAATTTVDGVPPLSGTTTTVGFNGGDASPSIYSGLAPFSPTTPVLVTTGSTTATKALGDKAYIAAQVDAPSGQLLQSGDYVVSIPVTLAP